ncbi:Alpha/beta hydrolase fold-3 domain protein [Acidimicrobium ferrooxidans DSM 10331]|uniref:Alpha/beta hydrolase fold-3 domain protein n=1 Tax=Acidimicrobium ferrooxidans (strain DSM 10331 / JCM 15462 / NBRC 103882 / ICP) TaxID=525909 RepID=C7M1M2_ACIFD|nr:alpha/beta hydrolase [Acidimicrobium ferrooxidans]ACU53071.1 Alpha/beta hydrolase fold-3 domain protein [Acidimicrobium ferrooxidans DSM 10331]
MALDPTIASLLEQLAATGATTPVYELSLADARAGLDLVGTIGIANPPAVARVEQRTIDAGDHAIAAELVWGSEAPRAALLFVHGGGFVLGSLRGYGPMVRHLAASTGALVVSLDYRLAPEHRFPAAVDDTLHGLRWLAAERDALGVSVLGVVGDSAGGNLAAVASIAAPSEGIDLALALELYPATDLSEDLASLERFGEGYYLTAEEARWFASQYLGDDERLLADWRANPMAATDLDDLPLTIVATAGYDPIGDAGRRWAARLAALEPRGSVPDDLDERLRQAGVEVSGWARGRVISLDFPTLVHGFASIAQLAPAAGAACELSYGLAAWVLERA